MNEKYRRSFLTHSVVALLSFNFPTHRVVQIADFSSKYPRTPTWKGRVRGKPDVW